MSKELSRDLSSVLMISCLVISGAESMKLICDVSEAIKRELDIFIVVSLEAVEEIAKNTDPLVSLCRDAFVDLG